MDDMAKKIHTTCGVLITDGENLLICHPTHGRKWDIPKGKKEEGESEIDAAVRELREETGLIVNPSELEPLGLHDYKPTKRLHLFKWSVESIPDADKLVCISTFPFHGKDIPEMDAFTVVPYIVALDMVNPDLSRIIRSLL